MEIGAFHRCPGFELFTFQRTKFRAVDSALVEIDDRHPPFSGVVALEILVKPQMRLRLLSRRKRSHKWLLQSMGKQCLATWARKKGGSLYRGRPMPEYPCTQSKQLSFCALGWDKCSVPHHFTPGSFLATLFSNSSGLMTRPRSK